MSVATDDSTVPASLWEAARRSLGVPIRAWALYLGVKVAQVSHLELGRRSGAALLARVLPLRPVLPPPWGTGPPTVPLELPLPVVAPVAAPVPVPTGAAHHDLLRAHLMTSQTAANLRAGLMARHQRVAILARQRAAVDLLMLTPVPRPAHTQRLLEVLQLEIEIATAPNGPLDAARLAHDMLRLWLLETEAAAVGAWLGVPTG